MLLFAVVYGVEWDAIEYFSKYHVACQELYSHTRSWAITHDFYPMLVQLQQDPVTSRFNKDFAQYLDPSAMLEIQNSNTRPAHADIQAMMRKLA